MLGNAETVGGATDLFTQVNKSQKIYLRKAAYFRTALEFPHRGKEAAETEPAISSPPSAQEIKAPDLQEYVDEILLREFSPAAVVLNSPMPALQFPVPTATYLDHSPPPTTLNLSPVP